MKSIYRVLSFSGLALTIVPSLLVFSGFISLGMSKGLMLVGLLAWFTTAPLWMNKTQNK